MDGHRVLCLWPDDQQAARGLRVPQLRTGGWVPLRLLSPPPSPRPVRRRTCIIESAFQYLFTLLLLWVAITVYIICLSVLPGSCSLLAEWFEEGEGGEKGETLTLCCHLKWWPGCLGVRGEQALTSHSPELKCSLCAMWPWGLPFAFCLTPMASSRVSTLTSLRPLFTACSSLLSCWSPISCVRLAWMCAHWQVRLSTFQMDLISFLLNCPSCPPRLSIHPLQPPIHSLIHHLHIQAHINSFIYSPNHHLSSHPSIHPSTHLSSIHHLTVNSSIHPPFTRSLAFANMGVQ